MKGKLDSIKIKQNSWLMHFIVQLLKAFLTLWFRQSSKSLSKGFIFSSVLCMNFLCIFAPFYLSSFLAFVCIDFLELFRACHHKSLRHLLFSAHQWIFDVLFSQLTCADSWKIFSVSSGLCHWLNTACYFSNFMYLILALSLSAFSWWSGWASFMHKFVVLYRSHLPDHPHTMG